MKRLEKLDVWRGAQDLAHRAYLLTMTPPLSRHFALSDQIRRAAISIPANIAEGYALASTLQFMRCLRISLGSAAELRSHLELVVRLELSDTTETTPLMELCTRVIAMLVGLLRSLSARSGPRFSFPDSRFPITPHVRGSTS
jgi:four helix bundle protein